MMAYKKKMVTIKKDDFSQLVIYIDQVLEIVDVLHERNSKYLNLNDFLKALEVYADFLKRYKSTLIKKYKLNYIDTLENIYKDLSQ